MMQESLPSKYNKLLSFRHKKSSFRTLNELVSSKICVLRLQLHLLLQPLVFIAHRKLKVETSVPLAIIDLSHHKAIVGILLSIYLVNLLYRTFLLQSMASMNKGSNIYLCLTF